MSSAKPALSPIGAISQQKAGQAPLALLGREREQLLLEAQLDGARAGTGGALVLRGEPGIGKSTLCHRAIRNAEGFQVVHARGHETEAEIAFLALADLLQPILHHLQGMPRPQLDALASVLGVGPAVPVDHHAVGAATLSLLAIAAEERPVLAVVDDAHWLDQPSADALAFAARRLEAERVALLFAARADEEAVAFDSTGLRELRLRGLAPEAARALLGASLEVHPPPAVLERLLATAAGNPLALIEAPRALSEAQLRGEEPLPDPLPAGAALSQAFERRLATLSEQTRTALLVAASADRGEMGAISRSLSALELGVEALEPAEEAGLIEISRAQLEFVHPLVRSVIYHRESTVARREAHRALSAALDGEPERRAWHLAAAAVEPSEGVAVELEQAGLAARGRSGHASAARAFERAAQLTPDAERRARRLLAAASDAQLAGRFDWAASCLESALTATADPTLRVDIRHLWGVVERFRGSTERACELFLEAASEIEPQDRERAASLATDAADTFLVVGNLRMAEALLRRAKTLTEGLDGEGALVVSGTDDFISLLRGHTPPPSRLLSRIEALQEATELSPSAFPVVTWAAYCLGWTEHHDKARSFYVGMIARARAESLLGALPVLLLALGELELRTGGWREAEAHLTEAAALAADSSQASVRAASDAYLARIEAARGREQECRGHLEEAEALALGLGAGILLVHVQSIRGLLELGRGDLEAAVAHLEATSRSAEDSGLGHPGVVPFEPDLIEAYWRSGQPQKAQGALAVLERKAERTGSSWARAAALRCRGMLAPAEEFEEQLVEALREHTRVPARFDRARTELCLGERLRRERQRADARPHLRAALDAFERLGAEPWARRAQAELGATAETAHPRDGDLDRLTPQELQVAMVVTEGATNKEAAATLFVSPKTIDAHLQHIYRKLGLRSRTQLAHALASNGNGAGPSHSLGLDGEPARASAER